VLNIEIISVPMGSEHTSFMIMRKNQWEDALFKSEDEKYEFDINLIHFKMVIKLLKKLDISDNPEKLIEEILKYRVLG
jgi:histone deacetylase complex regulatory component SIN3